MRFRFRLGPFTFGKSGARFSLWKGGSGVSIPLSKKNKGGMFGKVKVGLVMALFGSPFGKISARKNRQEKMQRLTDGFSPEEKLAIEALSNDKKLMYELQKNGVPWRGIQEALKDELPEDLSDRSNIAYKLVSKAMNVIFGKQNVAWNTEKRPSKSGKGETTWIVIP